MEVSHGERWQQAPARGEEERAEGTAGQHRQPLADCALDELWRGELDLELLALEQLRAQYLQVQKKLM
jgi:hypothetical protein